MDADELFKYLDKLMTVTYKANSYQKDVYGFLDSLSKKKQMKINKKSGKKTKTPLPSHIKIVKLNTCIIEYNTKTRTLKLRASVAPRYGYYTKRTNTYLINDGKIVNTIDGKEVSPLSLISKANVGYTLETDIRKTMQLFKILRHLHPKWNKQFNTNQHLFSLSTASHRATIRMFLLLAVKPEFLLMYQELGKFGESWIKSSASNSLKVENWEGTNLRSIFNLSKVDLKFIKDNSIKMYKLKLAREFSRDFGWNMEQSLKVLEPYNSSDFKDTWSTARGPSRMGSRNTLQRGHQGSILRRLAGDYSYTKVLNWTAKNRKDLTYDRASNIVDTWNMLDDMEMLGETDKAPIVAPSDAKQFHDTIIPYYNRHKARTKKSGESLGFRGNTSRAANYMDLDIDGYEFRVIRSGKELDREGMALSHCVGGYYGYVDNGRSVILSMRPDKSPKTPFITIEVVTRGKTVQTGQVSGKHNRSAKKAERDVINKWTKESTTRLEKYLEFIKKKQKNDKTQAPDLKALLANLESKVTL